MEYHRLREDVILKKAPPSKGVYFLGDVRDGKFVVGYVGRSDSSIRGRLLRHNHLGRFRYFSFETTRTKREAFLLETEYYYLYRGSIINRIHPDMPGSLIVEHPSDTLGRVLKKRILRGEKHERD